MNPRTLRKAMCITTLALLAAAPAVAEKTQRTWEAKCSACHGDDGKGATTKGKEMKIADMATAAWQKDKTDDQIKKAIDDGVNQTKDGVHQQMDAYKSKLRPEQIDDLVKYIRALAK